MVVVGIITILGVVVGPGLKKTYDDFIMKKTLSDADALLQACRSYYLIYNEFPADDGQGDYIVEDLAPFVPSNYFNKTKTRQMVDGAYNYYYQLTVKPFNNSISGVRWDFDNWITWGDGHTPCAMCLSFNADRDTFGDKYADMCKKRTTFLDLFGKRFPLSRPQPSLNSYWESINIPFPEFPLKSNLDTNSKNRYY